MFCCGACRPSGARSPSGANASRACDRSMMSVLVRRMQPDDTAPPIEAGLLVPCMRYSDDPICTASGRRAGCSGPPSMRAGRMRPFFSLACDHGFGRRPAGPCQPCGKSSTFRTTGNLRDPTPTLVAVGLAAGLHEVELAIRSVDDDGARPCTFCLQEKLISLRVLGP
jgi:hypothetical protein